MTIPSEAEVLASVTNDRFQSRIWEKHRNDARHPPGGYPFCDEYTKHNDQPFTRQHVFEHFKHSTVKGVISAIKWGYPKGGRPGGIWHPFSDAFRATGYAKAIDRFSGANAPTAFEIVSGLNGIVLGVGTATTTKIAYFAHLKSSEGACLIYDSMVRRAIAFRDDPDFAELRGELRARQHDIPPVRQQETYGLYLRSAHAAAQRLNVRPDQIELLLFRTGRRLPPRR